MHRLALAALVAQTDALYWMSSPRYDLYSTFMTHADVEPAPSSQWVVSKDAYELKVRLPELEPTSVRAALGVDGTKVEVIGERKIEGCQCHPSTVKEIALPYRPRVEDVDLALHDGVLALRLARQPPKAESTTPLKVSVAQKEEQVAPADEETRSLRFVPHESALAPSLEKKEATLTEKFRAAALAAVAVQHEEPSVKDAAAATAEAQADTASAPAAAAATEGEASSASTKDS